MKKEVDVACNEISFYLLGKVRFPYTFVFSNFLSETFLFELLSIGVYSMNPTVFSTRTPSATNNAGGIAYAMPSEHALAQYAMTGTFNNTFYTTGEMQLESVLNLCRSVEPEFIAKLAVYAREKGYMKDMPAFLLAFLAKHDTASFIKVFDKVITNGTMLRKFCHITRSGVTGRKSFGSRPKKMINTWLNSRSPMELLRASVGSSPTFGDIVKMTHPKAATPAHEAMFAFFIGKPFNIEKLPTEVVNYLNLKANGYKPGQPLPDVPFRLLTSLDLDRDAWLKIGENAGWHMARMNLNTFHRNELFSASGFSEMIAAKLSDREAIRGSKAFPYQLLAALKHSTSEIPKCVREALESAMETSLENIPKIDGKIWVLPDTSGSMQWAATGLRGSATSKVLAVDIAALVASAFLRVNPDTGIVPFDMDVHTNLGVSRENSIAENSKRIASAGGGGTNCSVALQHLNTHDATGDLIVFVSDNESWIDPEATRGSWRSKTTTMEEWEIYKRRNPKAKMVCVDIQANHSTQVPDTSDILNIGGFSDHVFTMIANFANGVDSKHWVNEITALW